MSPIIALNLALASTPVRASLDGDTVVFSGPRASYRFRPEVYHRIDAFVYGVRVASGLEGFSNTVVRAVVDLELSATFGG